MKLSRMWIVICILFFCTLTIVATTSSAEFISATQRVAPQLSLLPGPGPTPSPVPVAPGSLEPTPSSGPSCVYHIPSITTRLFGIY
jgi:hypothetical protein